MTLSFCGRKGILDFYNGNGREFGGAPMAQRGLSLPPGQTLITTFRNRRLAIRCYALNPSGLCFVPSSCSTC